MALTLPQLREKANARLTPMWTAMQKIQAKYLARTGAYKAVPIRKLHIETSDYIDVWGRVVADGANGYSMQVLVEFEGKQYARAAGHGTGEQFNWKEVSVPSLLTEKDGEFEGPPNSMKIEDVEKVTPAHTITNPDTGEETQVPESRKVVGSKLIAF